MIFKKILNFGDIPNNRDVFLFFSEMCCEAKRWKPFAEPIADPALYQRFPRPPDSFPEPSPEFSPESSPEPY